MESTSTYLKLNDKSKKLKPRHEYDFLFCDLNDLITDHKDKGCNKVENEDIAPYFLPAFDAEYVNARYDEIKLKNKGKNMSVVGMIWR